MRVGTGGPTAGFGYWFAVGAAYPVAPVWFMWAAFAVSMSPMAATPPGTVVKPEPHGHSTSAFSSDQCRWSPFSNMIQRRLSMRVRMVAIVCSSEALGGRAHRRPRRGHLARRRAHAGRRVGGRPRRDHEVRVGVRHQVEVVVGRGPLGGRVGDPLEFVPDRHHALLEEEPLA